MMPEDGAAAEDLAVVGLTDLEFEDGQDTRSARAAVGTARQQLTATSEKGEQGASGMGRSSLIIPQQGSICLG